MSHTIDQARAVVFDRSASASALAEIASEYRELWPVIEQHPNAYPELIEWIRSQSADSSAPEAPSRVEPQQFMPQPAVQDGPPRRRRWIGWVIALGCVVVLGITAAIVVPIAIPKQPGTETLDLVKRLGDPDDTDDFKLSVSNFAMIREQLGTELQADATERDIEGFLRDAASSGYYGPWGLLDANDPYLRSDRSVTVRWFEQMTSELFVEESFGVLQGAISEENLDAYAERIEDDPAIWELESTDDDSVEHTRWFRPQGNLTFDHSGAVDQVQGGRLEDDLKPSDVISGNQTVANAIRLIESERSPYRYELRYSSDPESRPEFPAPVSAALFVGTNDGDSGELDLDRVMQTAYCFDSEREAKQAPDDITQWAQQRVEGSSDRFEFDYTIVGTCVFVEGEGIEYLDDYNRYKALYELSTQALD